MLSNTLLSEPLFTTFSARAPAHATVNANAFPQASLQEAPKLDNNDLLLENLDLNLMLSHSPVAHADEPVADAFLIDGDIFDSVFKHPEDPLLSVDTSATDEIDAELKGMFDFVEPVVTVKSEPVDNGDVADDIFKTFEIEQRAHSTVPVSSIAFAPSPSSNKRSYSVAGLESSNSDSSSSNKKDKLGCTPYTRKQRSNPLPPVIAKGEDTASQKRARNTEAARRSRARKMERMAQLENKCEGLIQENELLKRQVAELRAQMGL